MLARAQTWWTVLRIGIEERLVYRGDFWLGTLARFLPIITQIFLWGAVFEGMRAVVPATAEPAAVHLLNLAVHSLVTMISQAWGAVYVAVDGATQQMTIAGYGYHDFVAYYLLTMISRAFSSMPGLARGVALQIRNGEIKKYLIQPVDLVGFLLLMRVAHKIVYYGVALAPFALVFYLARGFFPGWPPAEVLAAYIASLLLAFLLGFFLEATIGMIGFWFLEVSSLLFVYMLFNFFFSGHMFPLDMLPAPLDTLFMIIPLQYLAYFPAAVFLQKITGPALWYGLAIQAAWVVFFIVACRVTYWRGVKRYSGFGG